MDQQFFIVEGIRKIFFHGLFEYFPNTYLHSFFFHFLGHNACGMDQPEDQPLYVSQALDSGSHCCDLLKPVVGSSSTLESPVM